MMKNKHLAKAVASQKFYEFRTKLEAKCKEVGISSLPCKGEYLTVNEEYFEELEEILIGADVGVSLTIRVIEELLKDETVLERSKLIIISSEIKPAMGMITSPNLTEENYLDLTIAPFTDSQIELLIKQFSDFNYDKEFLKTAAKISCGNPSIVEQIILLQKEFQQYR